MRKTLLCVVLLAVIGSLLSPPAIAGKKEKRPKPYESPEGTLLLAHSLLIQRTGQRVSVTLQEFESKCAIPETNGVDAFVYEVPDPYQKIKSLVTATVTSVGSLTWGLYFVMYDQDCKYIDVMLPQGARFAPRDTIGEMPPGIAYAAIANLEGARVSVRWKATPL